MEAHRTRIALPSSGQPGEVIEVKTLIAHPMESGFRRDAKGEPLPRNILTRFACHYRARSVIEVDLHPGVAANPFISFSVRLDQSGEFEFLWEGQNGLLIRETRRILVADAR